MDSKIHEIPAVAMPTILRRGIPNVQTVLDFAMNMIVVAMIVTVIAALLTVMSPGKLVTITLILAGARSIHGLLAPNPNIRRRKYPNAADWVSSYTTICPLEFKRRPLYFVAANHAARGGKPFSCHLLGTTVTFVAGESNVAHVTNAEESTIRFAGTYGPFLEMFGEDILTIHTARPQMDLLQRWLKKKDVENYIDWGYETIMESFQKFMPNTEGEVDLAQALMMTMARAAGRNFFGKEVVDSGVLDHFGYTNVFNKFELFIHIIKVLTPSWLQATRAWIGNKISGPDQFAVLIRKLTNTIPAERLKKPTNVFEDIASLRGDPNGPSAGKESSLAGFNNFFFFGSFFNSFHMADLFLRVVMLQGLWTELRNEQFALDAIHGRKPTQAKIQSMTKLRQYLGQVLDDNCMPLLLRTAVEDITLPDGTFIPAGELIAFSPRLEQLARISKGPEAVKASERMTWGRGKHRCIAETYAMNGMCVAASELIRGWDITPMQKVVVEENLRALTFPTQPSLKGRYRRVSSEPKPVTSQ